MPVSWALGVFTLSLLLPSGNFQGFDGLPLSTPHEAIFLALLLPFLLSRAMRTELRARAARLAGGHAVLLAAALVAAALKLVLLIPGDTGFEACYATPVAPPPEGRCEAAYANPFPIHGDVTRVDEHIDFGPRSATSIGLQDSDWDLSFVNDMRFNFRDPDADRDPDAAALRTRLPLNASWRGDVQLARGDALRVSYVGEGSLTFDGRDTVSLPRAREQADRVIRLDRNVDELTARFAFEDQSATQARGAGRPYAMFRIEERSSKGWQRLETTGPHLIWSVAGLAVTLLFGAFAALLAWCTAARLGRAAPVCVGAAAAAYAASEWATGPFDVIALIAILAVAVPVALLGPVANRLTFAYAYSLAVFAAWLFAGGAGTEDVLYRDAGDDWLTYESFARSILAEQSLRAGEDVFYYQPGFRYLVFLEHLVFGDGDVLWQTAARAAVVFAVLALSFVLSPRRARLPLVAVATALCGLMLALLNAPDVAILVEVGASETPTWVLMPLLLAGVATWQRSTWRWATVAAGAVSLVIIRPNQFLAAALLIAVGIYLLRRDGFPRGGRLAAGATGVVLVATLPLIHNVVYGGEFVPLTTSGQNDANLVVQPSELLHVRGDDDVRDRLKRQVRGLGYLSDPGTPTRAELALVLYALLAVWLATIAMAVTRWRRRLGVTERLLLLLPVGFLLPHLLYQVYVYYPRHIVIAYLAMGATSMVAIIRAVDGRQGDEVMVSTTGPIRR